MYFTIQLINIKQEWTLWIHQHYSQKIGYINQFQFLLTMRNYLASIKRLYANKRKYKQWTSEFGE